MFRRARACVSSGAHESWLRRARMAAAARASSSTEAAPRRVHGPAMGGPCPFGPHGPSPGPVRWPECPPTHHTVWSPNRPGRPRRVGSARRQDLPGGRPAATAA
ncbi:unnamed protein product [Prorocentrum cordatum]|uniref:Uncharacterized protein n=1 Tax=Prorocentrum cordatum TaxID=2364126 RepID=A0ABN9Q3M2_9DINO|nr:unnamed protein product [Polarella glacialis]